MARTKTPTRKTRTWTEEQKAEAVLARQETRAVNAYLNAIESGLLNGRRRSAEERASQVEQLRMEMAEVSGVKRVILAQRVLDLEAELGVEEVNIEALQEEFVEHAASWAQRKGVSYRALRDCGVPAAVLREAGILRHG